ncbi:hypothetical protein [Priestia megaterium]|uniref:hypothetical protein n=1 Tax=Priestia megaterium TaxID=1404 RepID=UPI0012D92495|nr:hypothetical protein [Priestia megaterium]MUL34751.1 hypothetical protein [Priestia megaterium]
MEKVEQVFSWTWKIYLWALAIAAFWLAYYGLCYPTFFTANATVFAWVGVAILFCTAVTALAFGVSYLVVYVKDRRNRGNNQDSDID